MGHTRLQSLATSFSVKGFRLRRRCVFKALGLGGPPLSVEGFGTRAVGFWLWGLLVGPPKELIFCQYNPNNNPRIVIFSGDLRPV